MTNTLALVLGTMIVVAVGVDMVLFGSDHMIFLGKKLFWLLDWMAFWR